MNWDRIARTWAQFKGSARRQWRGLIASRANGKQLAEWLARQHKKDPIHK